MTIRVLVADDEELVRAGFRRLLESEPDITVVVEARDGKEAVEQARGRTIDVALMDIRMPRLDGLQATRVLLRDSPATRVVILTTYDLDEYVFDASTRAPAASCSRTPHRKTSSGPSGSPHVATHC